MGVPHYFKYLVSNFSDGVISELDSKSIILYFDFNSIIYDAKNQIQPINDKTIYEYLIIEKTIDLLNDKINSINLLKINTIYIAIDGVAPMAKIMQQRQRRYKSIKEKHIITEINNKYQRNLDKPSWDSNAISPGTKFMQQLTIHLTFYLNYIKLLYPNITTILDDSSKPGEGEHKLMKHIQANINRHIEFNKVIYGLDADLIVLALLKNVPNIYLFRESSYFPFKVPDNILYLFLDVKKLRDIIKYEFNITNDSHFVDYIFLTFLLGNDFIPNLFILKIQESGFEYIKKFYKKTCKKLGENLIIENTRINYQFLQVFLGKLLKIERELLIQLNDDYSKWKPFINPRLDEYERRLVLLNYYPYFVKTTDVIKLGKDAEWQERFYKYWLGQYDDKMLVNMTHNYCEGLEWILHYYINNECVDWFWYYRYPIAPSIKLLCDYDGESEIVFNRDPIDNSIFNAFQMAIILPVHSHKLIPKKIRQFLGNPEYQYLFPTDFKLLTLHKKYYHECFAVLPNIENDLYERIAYNMLKL